MKEIQYIFEIALTEGMVWFPMVLCVGIIYQYLKTIDAAIDGIVIISSIAFSLSYNLFHSFLLSVFISTSTSTFCYFLIGNLISKLKANSILVGIIFSLILHSISVLLVGESLRLDFETLSFIQKPSIRYLIILILIVSLYYLQNTIYGIKLKAITDAKYFNSSISKSKAIVLVYIVASFALNLGVILYTTRIGVSRSGGGFEFLITTLCSYLFVDKISSFIANKLKTTKYLYYKIFTSVIFKAFIGSILFQFIVTAIIFYTQNPIYWKLIFGIILLIIVVDIPFSKLVVKKKQPSIIDSTHLLFHDLSYSYNDGFISKVVLSNLNVNFLPGLNIIKGKNGSGKTTILNLISGIINPSTGSVLYKGKELYKNKEIKIYKFSQIPFESLSTTSTVLENKIAVQNITGLSGFKLYKHTANKNVLPDFQIVQTLSGGQAQKLNMQLSEIFDADIILADEPTSGLDDASFFEFSDFLNSQMDKSKIIIVVTHDNRFNSLKANFINLDNLI